MSVSYDGRLLASKDGIEACCRQMDALTMTGQIYRTAKGSVALRDQTNPRKGFVLACCPFCGSKAEVRP